MYRPDPGIEVRPSTAAPPRQSIPIYLTVEVTWCYPVDDFALTPQIPISKQTPKATWTLFTLQFQHMCS